MAVMLLLFFALLFVALAYFVRMYNGLVALRAGVSKAWSNIDVLLTQRHDELPKLVETCKRYMAYEQETLERVMHARAAVFKAQGAGDVASLGAAEGQLRQGLGRLFGTKRENQSNHSFTSSATKMRGSFSAARRTRRRFGWQPPRQERAVSC